MQQIEEDYTRPEGGEYIIKTDVGETTNMEITPVTPARSELHTPMRASTKCNYAFIPEDTKHLQQTNTCVIDNFVGIYGKYFKRVTREWVISTLNELSGGYVSDLDHGLENPGVTYFSDANGNVIKADFDCLQGITLFRSLSFVIF